MVLVLVKKYFTCPSWKRKGEAPNNKEQSKPWKVVRGVCNIQHKPVRYLHYQWTQVLSVHPTGVKGIAALRLADWMLNRQSVRSR